MIQTTSKKKTTFKSITFAQNWNRNAGLIIPPKELDFLFLYQKEYIFFSFYSIYICGGYNLILSVKECYKLNLSNTTQGWVPIAPLIKGRFNFKMVAANGFIYAVGGEGPFSEHDDIEVHCKYLQTIKKTFSLPEFITYILGSCK